MGRRKCFLRLGVRVLRTTRIGSKGDLTQEVGEGREGVKGKTDTVLATSLGDHRVGCKIKLSAVDTRGGTGAPTFFSGARGSSRRARLIQNLVLKKKLSMHPMAYVK